jgi:hypothetical protein
MGIRNKQIRNSAYHVIQINKQQRYNAPNQVSAGYSRANYYQQNYCNNNPGISRRTMQSFPREPAGWEQQGHVTHSEIHYYQNHNPRGA